MKNFLKTKMCTSISNKEKKNFETENFSNTRKLILKVKYIHSECNSIMLVEKKLLSKSNVYIT